MARITISLDEYEKKALITLAAKEFREPRAQAALIVRHELERLGLLQLILVDSTLCPDTSIAAKGKTHEPP
jgi:hypothetical protein